MSQGDVDPAGVDREWVVWRGTYEDEWVVFGELVPYRYLERVAIMHHEGKLSLYRARELAALELAREPGAWVGKPTLDEVERPRCTERVKGARCEGRAGFPRILVEGRHICADCAARRLGYRCPRCGIGLRGGSGDVLAGQAAVSATRDGRACCVGCVDWVEGRS